MKWTELVEFARRARTTADDQTAARAVNLYPTWEADIPVYIDDRYQYNGKLYKCIQAHTTQADWTPDATSAMWTVIDIEHAGTIEDPIPWAVNMECYEGKYYIWDKMLYKCIRDSGEPLAYAPDQLLENYFKIVK